MTKNKSKKQELILNTAKELFWKHGFKRVTVEEICKNAKVSKMTFYKFYTNKIELAKTVYNNVMQEGIDKFHTVIHEESPAEDKINKLLLLKFESTNNMSIEFLQDFYADEHLGLKEFIEEKTQEAWKFIIDDFIFAQNKGWFRKDVNPELFMSISQKLSELVNDTQLLKLYNSPQELIMATTNFFIYGLIPHKE
ncbi:MAG: TetR/AcrR family transcriptional regulator [Bacteroidetes bacterium]|nr:MAG: TetR/AcrR family transcriptional regulator [Bacteroidota bacterium]